MEVKLIIFDLDETLVHATNQQLAHAPDFYLDEYCVYVRPHVKALLDGIATKFDIAVWSSASSQYVNTVVPMLFDDRIPLKFVWSVDRCVQRPDPRTNGYVYIKDLRKVQGQGYRVEQILMVDDSPEKLVRQPRNHIRITPFTGDPRDDALLELLAVLSSGSASASPFKSSAV